jgi:hypothetical protein
MTKSIIIGVCAVAFTATASLAQAMGPGPQAAGMTNRASPMDANDKMMMKKKKKKGMMKSGMDDGMSGGMKKDGMTK